MNKKLVIAALLAAVIAEGEEAQEGGEVQEEVQEETPQEGGEAQGEGEGEAGAGEGEAGAGEGEAGAGEEGAGEAGEEGAGEEGAGEGEGAGEEGGEGEEEADPNAGKIPEEIRAAWKDAVTDAVLCDQGDSALWLDAQDTYKALKDRWDEAVEAKRVATEEWTPLNQALTARTEAANQHREDNAQYLLDYESADSAVNDLVAASGGSSGVPAAEQALETLTNATADAVTAVNDQLARIEALVAAQATQVAEKAAWDERVSAAGTAKGTAQTAKDDADDALTEAEEQVTKRSWLFTVLGRFDTDNWASGCDTDSNGYCQLAESASTASTSTWTWNTDDHCDYNDGQARSCKMYGLKGDTVGLTQAAATYLGAQEVLDNANSPPTVTTAATGLYTALNTNNWAWVSASVDGGTTKLADAVAKFEAWQDQAMVAEAMLAACWVLNGDGSDASHFTAVQGCEGGDVADDSGTKYFNPIMQNSATAGTQAKWAADAATTRQNFGDGTGNADDKAITATMQSDRARAQCNLWYGEWAVTGLQTELTNVGDPATRTDEITNGTWSNRTVGAAEAAVAAKQVLLTAATEEENAAIRWQTKAEAERVAAGNDLTLARALLEDLTEEIAPLARAETDARVALAEAQEAEAARLVAEGELGDAYVAANGNDAEVPATGARAVLAAATVAKESVDAQQAFHDARVDWATDALAPAALKLQLATEVEAALKEKMDAAEAVLDAARDACKSAAFAAAQQAREDAVEAAQAKEAKVAEVSQAYTAKAAFATDGSAGTLCNFPAPDSDGVQAPRLSDCVVEGDETPMCCGAAQRFLKDGTKLSIETCQLASATTYTYYPALPADALVAPTPETWRFHCISAAQKLAAAAAAALATGYMMA